MAPRRKNDGKPPIDRQCFVDYAPTDRARCKSCQGSIRQNDPRFCRKIRSPWHDGFDVQYHHLACGKKWCNALSEIHHLGALNWEDFVSAADEWDEDIAVNDPQVVLLKAVLEHVFELAQIIIASNITAVALQKILKCNQFPVEAADRLKKHDLSRIIADFLLRGRLPACPVCEKRSLVCAGFEAYCIGYADATTKCDFLYSWCPANKITSKYDSQLPQNTIEGLKKRTESICVPQALQGAPWKQIRASMKDAHRDYPDLFLEAVKTGDGYEEELGHGAKAERDGHINELGAKEVLKGVGIFVASPLCVLPPDSVQALVTENGGTYIETRKELRQFNVLPSIGLADRSEWKRVKKTEGGQIAVACTKIILDEQWLKDIVTSSGVDSKFRAKVKKESNKVVGNGNDEEPGKGKVKTERYTGPCLRLKKYMARYRIDGGKPFTIPLPRGNEIGPIQQPKINANSPLMQIDGLFSVPPEEQDAIGDSLHSSIYVDKYNNAYTAVLTYCDLGSGKNSFYIMHLIETSPLTSSRASNKENLKRKSNHTSAGPRKKAKCVVSEDKENTLFDDDEVLETTIDYSQVTEEDFELQRASRQAVYFVFRKWGRTGENDPNKAIVDSYGSDLAKALKDFHAKYKELTKVEFDRRFHQEEQIGGYRLVELDGYHRDSGDGQLKSEKSAKANFVKEEKALSPTTSSVDSAVYELLTTLFSDELMSSSLRSMRIDTTKFDLKKLSISQLTSGYKILTELEDYIRQRKEYSSDSIEASRIEVKIRGLTSMFYTTLPFAFDQTKIPPPIDNLSKLKQQCVAVEDLIKTAHSAKAMLEVEGGTKGTKIDRYYNSLKVDVKPLHRTSAAHELISRMVRESHGASHTAFTLSLRRCYALKLRGIHNYRSDLPNKKLLWHGSRLSNWGGILTYGLVIAPPEAPSSGFMFDKGLYFADMVSKSAQYCMATEANSKAYLLLSEVALGKSFLKVEADEKISKKLGDCNSTWGIGRTGMSPSTSLRASISDEGSVEFKPEGSGDFVLAPCGDQIDQTDLINDAMSAKSAGKTPSLLYNEYIVYDTTQVMPRFLVQVEFKFKSFAAVSDSDDDDIAGSASNGAYSSESESD